MTEWQARDEQELRRFLRTDERWRGSVDEIAVWLDRVFTAHTSFLSTDEVLWQIAQERLFAIHGRTAGEPLLDIVHLKYAELAKKSGTPSRSGSGQRWLGRLGWFACGFFFAIPSVTLLVYFVGKGMAKEVTTEVKMTIAASPDEVWSVLSDIRQWPTYNFPESFDDDSKLEFSESTKGVGATVKIRTALKDKWTKSITAVDPKKSVSYETKGFLDLKGVVTLARAKTGTEVVWKLTQAPTFFSSWFKTKRSAHGWEQSMKRALQQFDRQLRCSR